MSQNPSTDGALTLLLVEAGLTLIAVAAAFCWPNLGSAHLVRLETLFQRLAERKRVAVVVVGCSMLLLRFALLPWFPAPLPFTTDDFSFLLAADTFAHGRLANPAPAMWTHLESIHITMLPTYMSMYFPGPGLLIAAGKVLFGHPWAGILITGALMCAALCWMLQGWLPSRWALLGGMIVVIRIGLFSYWVNTYTGGATLSVTGGALVLGALPRLIKTGRFRYAMLLSIGVALLAITRPYEGVLVCLPVAVRLGYWILFGKQRPPLLVLARRAVLPVALLAAVLAWMGYYNYRAFGKATTLPYTVSRATYAVVPYYVWQPPHHAPNYRHAEMRRFYVETEMIEFEPLRSLKGFLFRKINTATLFFAGFALLPLFATAKRALLDGRMRFLAWCVPFWIVGLGIGVFLIPHYMAPFTAAVYAIGLQAMRHLRQFRFEGRQVGRTLTRLIFAVCIAMAGLRVAAVPLGIGFSAWPIGAWLCSWVGPGRFGAAREQVVEKLKRIPGKHLVLVRYSPSHEPADEWVYNDADVDGSKIIWAREMDPNNDDQLLQYYRDRTVWLVQPDVAQRRLIPYPRTLNMQARIRPGQ